MKLKYFLLFALLVPCWIIGIHGIGDIGMYYAVSQYAKNLEFEKIYGINAGVGHFFYGPLSLVLFRWMPYFSYETVRIIWIGINTLSYLLFWWALHKLYPFLLERKNTWAWVFIWVASIKAIHASFQSHNVQLLIAALLLTGEHYRRRGSFFSGWVSTIFGSIKVFPFFIAGLTFLSSDKKVKRGVIIALCFAVFSPLLVFGISPAIELYKVFLQNLGNFHDYAPLTKDAVTLSLASGIATWVSPFAGMAYAKLVTTILTVIIGLSFVVLVLKNKEVEWFSLAMGLMALLNSTTRPDYFIFFIPAFTLLCRKWSEGNLNLLSKIGLVLSFVLIDLISEWTLGNRELGHRLELYRLPVIGMILLCATLWSNLFPRIQFFRKATLNILESSS